MRGTKAKIIAFAVLKWLAAALTVLFLVLLLQNEKESMTAFDDMAGAVTAAADLSPMQQADNQMIKRLYGLDPAAYDGVILYYPTTNMGAEELLLVKLTDESQQEAVRAAIEKRVETQKTSFDGYGADQYAMLEQSVTEIRGNYALFLSAADTAPARQAFLDTF